MSLKVEELKFSYSGKKEILKGVSFDVPDETFVSILGPNGVGKSTLFKCILKLLPVKDGDILVDGMSVKEMTSAELARHIAYIPQFHTPTFSYSVFDMVLMGTTAQMGTFRNPGPAERKAALEAMEKLEITHLKDKSYMYISGGERQMTLIARAIAQQAKTLVMDEPSASLDFGNKVRLMKTVKGLSKNGYTVIQSTHDPEQAYFYSNKVLAMSDGKVLKYGKPEEVVTDEVISVLYGMDVTVMNIGRRVIACVPKDLHRM